MKIIYYTHNKKEFKFLLKYFNIKRKMKGQYPSYISINEDYDLSFSYVPEDFDVLIDVSKLIEEKKLNLSKRISEIDRKVELLFNNYIKISNKPSDWENTELTELPEKWCIRASHEKEDIKNWFDYKLDRNVNWGFGYAHYPEIEKHVCTSSEIHSEYTEISFSDFERLVLKKEQIGKTEQLEVGRWYKDIGETQYLFFITNTDSVKAYGYGLSEIGKWFSDSSSYRIVKETCRLATTKEVEEALKNESVKRGFKKGINIKTPNGTEGTCKNGVLRYDKTLNYLFIDEYACFIEGKWAEIVQDTHDDVYVKGVWDEFLKKEIDWSIPGQKVINDNELIILTNGSSSGNLFSGTVLKNGRYSTKIGEYSDRWNQSNFKLHTNPVTL